jgi:hypothetical protein
MIWKTFLVSFMLNASKYKRLLILDSTYTSSIPEKIPRRSRSYSDDLDNCTESTNSYLNKEANTFFSKPGYDNRYNGTDNDTDIVLNITKFNIQMDLLKTLENDNVSQHVKIKLINQYNKNEIHSPLKPDIFSGGLYKDWDYDIQ